MSTIHRSRTLLAAVIVLTTASAALAQSFPPRPQLGPEQRTNWSPHPGADSPLALVTQNLSSTLTPAQVASAIIGTGVVVQNVTYSGTDVAAGTFQGGTGIIGFESGIVLSSGDMNSIVGPNTLDYTTAINSTPSDPDLAALIPGYVVFDSCVLEFDFSCPTTQVLSFQFVFASEEFNEYVNSPYNDVFGFFVNGVNIALVPGTVDTPVSINNVNCNNPYNPPSGAHCSQFINNDLDDGGGTIDTEMDGLTLVFTATVNVSPGVNHIKLAIGDAGDPVLDSNVFIRAGSLICGTPGPVCELPMPALELGAGPQAVTVGTLYTHPIRAIATNGLAGQHVTITSVSASKDGSPMPQPANSAIVPALPIAGQPALGAFTWTPTLAQIGVWDFVYYLVDQAGTPGVGTVRLIVGDAGHEDIDCFLFASPAPATLSLGHGDTLLVDFTQAIWIIVETDEIPDVEIPDDPQLLGLNGYFQVALYDPVAFPADPVKCSNGLHIVIGVSTIESYGVGTGMTLWSTTPPLLDTDFAVQFSIS